MWDAEPAPCRVGDDVLAALASRATVVATLVSIELVIDRRRLAQKTRSGKMLACHTVYITSLSIQTASVAS